MPHRYTWYVVDALPSAIPSCNSLFESPIEKPAIATIDSNIENDNDSLPNDNDNNNNVDIDQ